LIRPITFPDLPVPVRRTAHWHQRATNAYRRLAFERRPLEDHIQNTASALSRPNPRTDLIRALVTIYDHAGSNAEPGVRTTEVFSAFAECYAGKPLIVVGCGFGGAGVAALHAGATHVYGLDLANDMPTTAHHFATYKPPLIREHQLEDVYTQLPATWTSDGNWYNPEVRAAVLQYDRGDSNIIIDIETATQPGNPDLLPDLILRAPAGTVLVRCRGPLTDLSDLINMLAHRGIQCNIFELGYTAGVGEWVVSVPRHGKRLDTAEAVINRGQWDDGTLVTTGSTIPWDQKEALCSRYLTGGHPQDDWVSVFTAVAEVYWIARGTYEQRLSFGHWTENLIALCSTYWCTLDLDQKVAALASWLHLGTASIPVGSTIVEVKMSKALRWHLTHLAALSIDSTDLPRLHAWISHTSRA